MRVLVTGATGTVGRAVVAELADLRPPHGPRPGGRREPPGEDAPGGRLEVLAASRAGEAVEGTEGVALDFEAPGSWDRALAGVDAVFLVRPPSMGRVGPLKSFVDATERAGGRRIVLLSLLGAEKNPVVPHRRLELHLERLGEDRGVEWTFLRASFFMQNLLGPHRRDIVERDEVMVPAGDGRTSFVDARDVGAVGARALAEPGHGGRAWDLTGDEALSYHEVADVLGDVLGRPIRYPEPSLLRFARRMRARGHPWGYIVVMAALYTTARLGLADRTTDHVQRVLGRPPLSLREFVRDHADRFRDGASR